MLKNYGAFLLTDYWFYIGLEDPDTAFQVPLQLMRKLLLSDKDKVLHVMIIRTLLEFTQRIEKEKTAHHKTLSYCCETMQLGFVEDPDSFVLAARYFKRHLSSLAESEKFGDKVFELTRSIYKKNLIYWQESTHVEDWLNENADLLTIVPGKVIKEIGLPFFKKELALLDKTSNWDELTTQYPDFDQMAQRFADAVNLFDSFIEKFYFIFYLLQLEGMEQQKERLIWKLNRMLEGAIDELDRDDLRSFITQIFDFAQELREKHGSSVLDMIQTMGRKIIDLGLENDLPLVYFFENKLINFGFESPGMVFVNEDWQLSVNSNHIKNIRVWLDLIEYSHSEMERGCFQP